MDLNYIIYFEIWIFHGLVKPVAEENTNNEWSHSAPRLFIYLFKEDYSRSNKNMFRLKIVCKTLPVNSNTYGSKT